jgi:hypothetical protein
MHEKGSQTPVLREKSLIQGKIGLVLIQKEGLTGLKTGTDFF